MSNIIGSDVIPHEESWSAVHPSTDEWKLLEYLLHAHVRTSRVKLKQAWQVAPSHLITNFQKRCEGLLVLHSFVDTFYLDEKNSIQNICRRGFKIEKTGMKFSVGNFSLPGFPLMRETIAKSTDLPEFATGNSFTPMSRRVSQLIQTSAEMPVDAAAADVLMGERRLFEFFLCEIGKSYVETKGPSGVGKSFVAQDEFHAMGKGFCLPAEYDSSFLLDTKPLNSSLTLHLPTEIEEDPSSTGEEQDHENFIEQSTAVGVLPQYIFKHDYVIYDTSQFECDPAYPENFCLPLCDNCQDAPSLIWCPSDNARLCEKCDEYLHKQNKVVSRHVRVLLNERARPDGTCKYHAGEQCEFFCLPCQIPACRICRPQHLHLDQSNRCHFYQSTESTTLESLQRVFKAELKQTEHSHPLLEKRKRKLKAVLADVQNLFDDSSCNMNQIEQRCYSIVEEALLQLQGMAESKMCVVLGDQRESQRQLDQIEWSESYLRYLQSVLPSADFLMSWLRHCQLRDEMKLLCCGDNQDSQNVLANMQLEGRVNLRTESALKHMDEPLNAHE